MINQPSKQQTDAILRVALTADGQKLLSFLRDSLATRDKENRTTTGEMVARGQGRSLQLQEIIELLDGPIRTMY